MAKYLVVAHQTAGSPELIAKLQELDAQDAEAEFTLLVPATSTAHLLTVVDGETQQIAQRRASEATTAFRAAGLLVTNTIIGDPNPLKAIEAELQRDGQKYAMTIIGMLPPGLSHWFRRDLQHQAQARLPMPVVVIIAGHATHAPASPLVTPIDDYQDVEPLSLQQFASRLGQTLECADGEIGKVREVLYDYLTGAPLWAGIFEHAYSVRPFLVPARAVRVAGDHLKTSLSRQQVLTQPPISIGEGFCSLSEEEAICRYFGLPFDDIRDTRVLRRKQDLPGRERNEQHILASELPESTSGTRARPA